MKKDKKEKMSCAGHAKIKGIGGPSDPKPKKTQKASSFAKILAKTH